MVTQLPTSVSRHTDHLDNGRQVWNRQPITIEDRESGDVVHLEQQIKSHRVLIGSSSEGVPHEAFECLDDVVAAEGYRMGVVCMEGARRKLSDLFFCPSKCRRY